MIQVAINGAGGRMGHRLVALGAQAKDLQVIAAIDHDQHSDQGKDAGTIAGIGEIGILLGTDYPENLDAIIDFSTPEGAQHALDHCLKHQAGLVLATTGLEEDFLATMHQASEQIPIVYAPNMSLAVNLTMKLCETVGAALKNQSTGVDVEIIERHHRFKKDSPSGTALRFGEVVADAMGKSNHRHGREGIVGERPANEIGYHAVRTGDNPGEHTIVFGMLGETIELKVAASNRDCYATGALEAAKWLKDRQPGCYSMFDVLGL